MNPYAPLAHEHAPASTYVVRFPLYCLWCLWGFLRCWLDTRHWHWLLQGLPALAIAALLGIVLLNSGQPASQETITSYLDRARQAVKEEEFDQADFYFRKLAAVAPGNRDVIYEHALLDAERENYEQAALKMESLLQEGSSTKDTRVHLWLAERILDGTLSVENSARVATDHLQKVLDSGDKNLNLNAHRAYVQLYLQQSDIPKAIEHLEPVATALPEAQLLLAALYRLTKDERRMQMMAQRAEAYFANQVDVNKSDKLEDWHKLAESYVLLEDFDQADKVLDRAHERFSQDSTRRMRAEVLVMWSDHVAQTDPTDVSRRMKLLDQAFQLAPDNSKVLQRLQDLAIAEGPAAEEAHRQLQQALAEGIAPGVIHFLFGTSAAMKGDDEAAIRHLNQSIQNNPRTAVTLNNLAFVMARAADPDLKKALDLANQAVRYAPLVASFRETRGQILIRLQRYSEGISDLEFALPQITNVDSRLKIHESLEEAYRELGDQSLGDIHRQKAAELKGSKDVPREPSDTDELQSPVVPETATPANDDTPEP